MGTHFTLPAEVQAVTGMRYFAIMYIQTVDTQFIFTHIV